MKTRRTILLALFLVVFSGREAVPSERTNSTRSVEDDLGEGPMGTETNIFPERQFSETIGQIKALSKEINRLMSRKYQPSDIPLDTPYRGGEEIDRILSGIPHPNRTLRALEEIRDALREHGSVDSGLISRLSPFIGEASGLAYSVLSPGQRNSIVPPSSQNTVPVQPNQERKTRVLEDSTWRMIGRFDDEYSIRRTVTPQVPDEGLYSEEEKPPGSSLSFPKSHQLYPNYPNPFNPSTTIDFDISGEIGDTYHVLLSIYDVRGRLIRNLIHEEKGPGHYSIAWDGKNHRGEGAGSGVFLYRIRVGDFTSVRKMLLVE